MIGRIGWKLLRKKMGFRTLLNVIPLNANLVKGSHGAVNVGEDYYPVLIQDRDITSEQKVDGLVKPTSICNLILNHIFE